MMTVADLISGIEWFYLIYFIGINLGYLALNLIATISLRRYLQLEHAFESQEAYSHLNLPVSIVMPAFNEAGSIIYSVKAMLQLEYPDYELIVVDDGSSDRTLEKLIAKNAAQGNWYVERAETELKKVQQKLGESATTIVSSGAILRG